LQVPSLPDVMSYRSLACWYRNSAGYVPEAAGPASAYVAAMIAAASDVPPTSIQPPWS
jgi:hypothetical protein